MPETKEDLIDIPSEGKPVDVEVVASVAQEVGEVGEAEHEEYSQNLLCLP